MEKAPFYSPELDRSALSASAEVAEQLLELLRCPELEEEIYKGNVTLAMIRPNVGPEDNFLGLDDRGCADCIEEMIVGFGVIAKFSFVFTPQTARAFYAGDPEASMLKASLRDPGMYDTRWAEFIASMTSGPTTALLLYSPNGDAIMAWRACLGHRNVEEARDRATIRGRLAVHQYNNLAHGSDSPEAVLREIGIITQIFSDNMADALTGLEKEGKRGRSSTGVNSCQFSYQSAS